MWRKSADVKPSSVPLTPPFTSRPDQDRTAPSSFQAPTTSQPVAQPTSPSTQPVSVVAAKESLAVSREGALSGASRIGAGLKIRGEISGKSDLYVDGEAQGKIRVAGARVTVGPAGRVQADIEAREIVVDGTVQGNLKGIESVRLGSSSRVQGSVLTPRLAIDEGARLRGTVETTRPNEPHNSSAATQPAEGDVLEPVASRTE